ncbi:MAG: LptF/LptG family permease [Cytophagaceae bacterium]|nr:LptF/LptG family permease [Cytophagaceae bacterium]
MKKLDWYIFKKYITTFFFVVAMLMLVIIVIDITEKLDDFLKNDLGPWVILTEYYFAFIPYMANLLSPITIFIATVFVTANLAAKTEIVAVLSSGVSYFRFMVPYIVGSILIALLVFGLSGWWIPMGNKQRIDFENAYIYNKKQFQGTNIHIKTTPTTYVYMDNYNSELQTGYNFTIETIRDKILESKLKAARVVWVDSSASWFLEDYFVRSFKGGKESIYRGSNKDTTFHLTPKDFEDVAMLYETFTMGELNHYIEVLEDRGAENVQAYKSEKYQRITYPFSIIILTIIGVMVSSKKTREGAGLPIAFGFILAFVYIIFSITSRSMANTGSISPLLAAWIPNIVFAAIGLYMYSKATK